MIKKRFVFSPLIRLFYIFICPKGNEIWNSWINAVFYVSYD